MDERKKFIEIFSGLERAYGQTKSRSKNQSGKLETDSWIVKEQLTEQKWHYHLDGMEPSLGIIPIRKMVRLRNSSDLNSKRYVWIG